MTRLLIDFDATPRYNEYFKVYRALEPRRTISSSLCATPDGGEANVMQFEVGVTEYKAVWPTKARDFVMLTVWDEPATATAPTGEKYVVASQSVPHARCPSNKAFVRGCVECG